MKAQIWLCGCVDAARGGKFNLDKKLFHIGGATKASRLLYGFILASY
jgi:hypothetical protein